MGICRICDQDCILIGCMCECHKESLWTWAMLKDYLLGIQEDLEEVNGVPLCKNCGMNYKWLVNKIEKLFNI